MTNPGDVVIALDCSTTACKAVAFNLCGVTVGVAARPLTMTKPQPGCYEQDAADWWNAARDALAELAHDLTTAGHRPVGMGITHQRETFVCLAEDGSSVRPAILWLDGRAFRQAERLATPAMLRTTGKPASTAPSAYKLAWLAENEPEVFSRTWVVADVHAYIALRLTGRACTSTASADSMGLLDISARQWDETLVSICGLQPRQLPTLAAPGATIGSR